MDRKYRTAREDSRVEAEEKMKEEGSASLSSFI
jgi:hypothetical protein